MLLRAVGARDVLTGRETPSLKNPISTDDLDGSQYYVEKLDYASSHLVETFYADGIRSQMHFYGVRY